MSVSHRRRQLAILPSETSQGLRLATGNRTSGRCSAWAQSWSLNRRESIGECLFYLVNLNEIIGSIPFLMVNLNL